MNRLNKALCWILDQSGGKGIKYSFYYQGKRYSANFRLFRKKRSVDQNKVLFMWLTYIANQTGNDVYDLYKVCEARFQEHHKVSTIFGDYYVPRSLKKENTKTFNERLEDIRKAVNELMGYWLPLPGEPDWEAFHLTYKDK